MKYIEYRDWYKITIHQKRWNWHASLGSPGAKRQVNVLDQIGLEFWSRGHHKYHVSAIGASHKLQKTLDKCATMHFVKEMYTHVHIFLNGALCDMGLPHSGVCKLGQLDAKEHTTEFYHILSYIWGV